MQQAAQARDKVLEALLEATEVPLPGSVLEAELEVRTHDAIHAFDHDEARFAEWLTEQGQTREEFDAEAKKDAERSVKTQLVLDAVADAEEVSVSDMELTQQIVSQAQRFGIAPEEFLQRTQQAGQLGAVYADVRRGKALAGVVRQATVTDEAGAAVDLSEFLGEDGTPELEDIESGEVVEQDEAGDATEATDEATDDTAGEAGDDATEATEPESAPAKA
jgi:trigger factor